MPPVLARSEIPNRYLGPTDLRIGDFKQLNVLPISKSKYLFSGIREILKQSVNGHAGRRRPTGGSERHRRGASLLTSAELGIPVFGGFLKEVEHAAVEQDPNFPRSGLASEDLHPDIRTCSVVELNSEFEKSCIDANKQIVIRGHRLDDPLRRLVTLEQAIPQPLFVGRHLVEISGVEN